VKAWIVAPGLLLTQAGTAMAQAIAVPSDPRARYELVRKVRRDDGLVEITTRRQGPSGTSFARREVDCRRRLFRYLSEGDTLEEARRPAPSPGRMSPLFDGSISDHIARFACR
jgi:hypothetical protein